MNTYLPNFDEIIKSANFDLNLTLVYAAALIVSALSGCWSSSIAEKKLHGTLIHLILGFALPVIYPVLILVILPSRKKKKEIEVPTDKEEDEDDLDLPFQDLNSGYFKQIYLDSQGNFTGPFIIDMEDSVVKAEAIIDVQDDLIVIETINKNDEKQRLRIPYSKMTSCSKA
jgi:hypothetical protein